MLQSLRVLAMPVIGIHIGGQAGRAISSQYLIHRCEGRVVRSGAGARRCTTPQSGRPEMGIQHASGLTDVFPSRSPLHDPSHPNFTLVGVERHNGARVLGPGTSECNDPIRKTVTECYCSMRRVLGGRRRWLARGLARLVAVTAPASIKIGSLTAIIGNCVLT
jgi:hypothetical protein